jgi:hypothetical protein
MFQFVNEWLFPKVTLKLWLPHLAYVATPGISVKVKVKVKFTLE